MKTENSLVVLLLKHGQRHAHMHHSVIAYVRHGQASASIWPGHLYALILICHSCDFTWCSNRQLIIIIIMYQQDWAWHAIVVVLVVVLTLVIAAAAVVMMIMNDSSQTTIFWMVGGQFLLLIGGCRLWFLMHRPYCTLDRQCFGLRMRMTGIHSFCFLCLSFAVSCLSSLNLQLAFLSDECWLSQSEASCCCDWWLISTCASLFLQLVFVMLSWSTTIMISFLKLTEEDCFGHAYSFHPCDVASPVQLHLKQDGLYAGQCWLSWELAKCCHVMPRVECKLLWRKHSSSLSCLW